MTSESQDNNNILKQFMALPPKTRMMLVILSGAGALMSYGLLRLQPRYTQLQTLSTTVNENQVKLDEARAQAAEIPALREKAAKQRQDAEVALSALPERQEIGKLQQEIRLIAQSQGADLKSLVFAAQPSNVPGTATTNVKAQIDGTYTQVRNTALRIEAMKRFMQTREMDISTANQQVQSNIGFDVYVRAPELVPPGSEEAATSAEAPKEEAK